MTARRRKGSGRRIRRLSTAAVLTLVVAGCAHAPPEAGFGDVETVLEERSGHRPRWQREPADEAAARRRVAELLTAELTADAAVEIALLNNRSLQAELAELGIAQARVIQAGRPENPVLVGAARFSDESGTNLDLGLAQSLLSLLMLPARKRLAGVQLEETRLRAADEVLHLVAEVKRAYYEAAGALQVREMRRLVAEAAESSYRLAQRIRAAGNASELDEAGERVHYEEARVALGRAEVEVSAARERLTRLLGLWGADVDWRIVDRLPELPAEEPPLERLETVAIERRFDLAAAIAEVETRATALGITRDWRYFLVTEIGVSAERETDGEWLIGPELTLELPIFDRRRGELAEHRAELRQSAQRMAALAVEIRSEVRELRARLVMIRDLVRHYATVVIPLREKIVVLTQQRVDYMLVGAFELLLAKENEYDAYRDYLEAVRDYWITRAELERALGGGFAPPASAETTPHAPAEERPAVHDHGEHR